MFQDSLTPFIQTYSLRELETENNSFECGLTPRPISTTTQFTGILMLLCKWELISSLWNADDWATQGGRVKTNWANAPFTASFRHFRPRACYWNGVASISQCAAKSPANWWTSPAYAQLSAPQLAKLNEIQQNYMIYDYCKDTKRFNGQMPPECYRRQF